MSAVSEADPILKVQGLQSGYGRSQVLFGVDMTCPARGAVAVLGRNGAGKTTFLKTLIGEVPVTGGKVAFDAVDSGAESTEKKVRRGMGYVPQDHAVFTTLSVRENLMLGGVLQKDKSSMDMVLDFFPKLGDRLGQQAGTLSGGERKMLAIGRALLGRPRLLMLDEPTEGVWTGVIEEISERLALLARDIAIIIVEQHVELALRLADHAYVMDRGTFALQGPSDEIANDPGLIRLLAP